MKTIISFVLIIFGISVAHFYMYPDKSISKNEVIQEKEEEVRTANIDFINSAFLNSKSGNRTISSVEGTQNITLSGEEVFNESSPNDVSDNPVIDTLIKDYLQNSKNKNFDIEIRNLYKEAKEKGVFFALKNDIIATPEKYNLSPDDIYQMAVEDLQNFPRKLEEPFAFDKVFTNEEKLFFKEKDAQEAYLITAYELYLTKTADDITTMNKMTADLVTDFENKGETSYANKIVEAKNNFESSIIDFSVTSN